MFKELQDIKKVRRSLIKQVDLLNKASEELLYDEGMSAYSEKMIEIYKVLVLPFLLMCITFMLNFFACFVVFLCKIFRRKT